MALGRTYTLVYKTTRKHINSAKLHAREPEKKKKKKLIGESNPNPLCTLNTYSIRMHALCQGLRLPITERKFVYAYNL